MSEVTGAIAEAPQNPAENTNMTATDFAIRRAEQLSASKKEPEPEQVEEPEELVEEIAEEPEVEEEPQGEPEAEEPSKNDVLSKLQLDDLSEDELAELGKALGSRAVERYGELTARRKAAEEALAKYKDSMSPLEEPVSVKDNPFSDIRDVKGLKEKSVEINEIIEWAEDILFESDEYGPEDEVTQSDGKPMTKAEVRQVLKNARRSKEKFLPDQLVKIRKAEESVQLQRKLGERALTEFEWLKGDKKNPQRERFISIASDPRLQEVYEAHPDLKAKLPYIFAHAVDNMNRRSAAQKPEAEAKKKIRITPPKTGIPSSSRSEKAEDVATRKINDLKSRFSQSGSASDFIKFRTQQLTAK